VRLIRTRHNGDGIGDGVGLGAAVNFGGEDICQKILQMYEKINKMPKFYLLFAREIFFPISFFWEGGREGRDKCPLFPSSTPIGAGAV